MNDARPVLPPKARKDQLIIKDLPDETLVYDQDTDQAHCLNHTAALVWKSCDGNKSVNEIQAALALKAGVPVDENVVWLALEQLEKFKLLEKPVDKPVAFLSGISRRQAVRALGVAAIALPMVTTILVPTAVQAVSPGTVPPGGCCTSPVDCQSQRCCHVPNCIPDPASPDNATKTCIAVGPAECPGEGHG